MTAVSDDERMRMRERPDGRPVMRQIWEHLAFLHWPVTPDQMPGLLPPGLELDTFEGVAYVGIVPFTIPLTRTARLGAPMAPAFHEINLRTYVHRGGRDPGVWFFSLDATSRLAVAGARLAYKLPYFAADITMKVATDAASGHATVDYRSRRRDATQASFSARYQPAGPVVEAAPGSLEFFLAERYLLYARSGKGLRTARVHHAPYPLQPAAATDVGQDLTYVASLSRWACRDAPPLVHYARGVDVEIFGPRLDNQRAVR
ncbi:MAG TPA: DUF2071 domain-containing protein [Polyangia bacterium]|jgi:uncharacterized protein YqjF (DUF2071 family)|nr:DUF2071 domain-containing protein [Polyangia bacterium]